MMKFPKEMMTHMVGMQRRKIIMQNQNQLIRRTVAVLLACGLIAGLWPGLAAAQDTPTFYVGGGGASDHNPGTHLPSPDVSIRFQ
jgi:hypothetical protein